MKNYSKNNIQNDKTEQLREILKNRVIFLDGAMGTMIQALELSEKDFCGNLFNNHNIELKGNNSTNCFVISGLIFSFCP